jgi:hypothetical protein
MSLPPWLARFWKRPPASRAGSPAAPSDLSPERLAMIEGNIRLVQEQAEEASGKPLRLGREGAEYLDGFINRQRERFDEPGRSKLGGVLGCYLGGCILAHYGGRWVQDEAGLGIEVKPDVVVFPLNKVRSQLENGPGDSVLAFFDTIAHADAISSRRKPS